MHYRPTQAYSQVFELAVWYYFRKISDIEKAGIYEKPDIEMTGIFEKRFSKKFRQPLLLSLKL